MKRVGQLICLLLALSAIWVAPPEAEATTVRAQVLSLQKGWNAVFLEVQPADSEPAVVFANTPVDVAAAYHPPVSPAQFVSNPNVDLFRQAGWGVWYAAERPDAFLKTLHAIHGQQAYLVHSKADFSWTVAGTVLPAEIRWQADGFNLVGFSVSPQAPPTFSQFFAGSKAHRHNQIYRLVGGNWRRVADASAEGMRSGEAFWIFCRGGSRYQGPLRVATTTRAGIFLGAGSDSLVLRNETDHPIKPTVEHVAAEGKEVPLSIVILAVGAPGAPVRSVAAPMPAGNWRQSLPPLEAGRAIRVPLEARTQELATYFRTSLLKITTDLGTEHWIPVVGYRDDLEAQ